jgi:hypothetical protein
MVQQQVDSSRACAAAVRSGMYNRRSGVSKMRSVSIIGRQVMRSHAQYMWPAAARQQNRRWRCAVRCQAVSGRPGGQASAQQAVGTGSQVDYQAMAVHTGDLKTQHQGTPECNIPASRSHQLILTVKRPDLISSPCY